MYHNTHPDPYANQYPPPPPLLPEDQHVKTTPIEYNTTPPVSHSTNSYNNNTDHGYVTNISGTQRESITMAGYNDNKNNLGYGMPQQPISSYNTHGDPNALTPSEYQQIELEEQKYNHQQKLLQQQQQQHQQQQYNNNGYEIDYRDEHDISSPYTPMVQPAPPKELENGYYNEHDHQMNNKNNKKNYSRAPGGVGGGGVTYAPADEAKYYQPYERDDRRGGGCNCCCYNPAMTCCSCFCMLISIGFLAAGIALIIASKVIGDKCNNQCGDAVNKVSDYTDANPCDAICNKVVHDGMFYGGIAVAALAGISVVWRLFMWMCAAGSRR